jgi:hypothetical protein
MGEIICRLVTHPGGVKAVDQEVDPVQGKVLQVLDYNTMGKSLEEILENDKRFGVLKPKNGKSFGYFIKNGDLELTSRQVRKGTTRALFRWYKEMKFKFFRARKEHEADLIIEYRSEADDGLLSPQTLAYMYYPLGSQYDGHMVINTRPFFTLHGEGIDMHYIDPINYPELDSGVSGATVDLDQVEGHEFGHGIFGLPHVSGIMAPNYGMMTEFLSELDIIRARAKGFERRSWTSRKYQRLKAWFLSTSDR